MDGADPAEQQGVIRVVLADDDEAFLASLTALIDEHPSLSVEATATNGIEATELVGELEPDALVIDLHMPLLDGVGAIAQLREAHPTLCVIALTGDESREIHEAVAAAGGDAVMLKSELVENLAERLVATIPMLSPGSDG
jgi:two-component system, NarL family, nitrate/nitrite response regulator NarL